MFQAPSSNWKASAEGNAAVSQALPVSAAQSAAAAVSFSACRGSSSQTATLYFLRFPSFFGAFGP